MRLLKGLTLMLFALACGQAAASDADTLNLTLQQAIDIALSDNPTIKVADQEIELKKVSDKETWQKLLPTAELNGSMSYTIKAPTMNLGGNTFKMGKDNTSTTSGALVVSLPLFAPAVYSTMKLTKKDIELAVEKSRSSRLDLIDQVTKAYYQLLLAQDSYKVLQDSYAFSERNYNMVADKYRVGKVSEYDKITAEVQMRSIKPSVVSAGNAVELAELQLKVLLGISAPDIHTRINDNLKNYETAVNDHQMVGNIDLTNNTSMRQLDLNEQMLQQTLKVQKTGFLPTLALQYQYQYQSLYNDNFKFWNYDWSPSSTLALSLSIPLFKADNFTKVKTARLQLEQLNETRINTERQLRMQAQSYANNMQASCAQVSSNKESVNQAERARLIAEKRYQVGKGTILELNSSEVQLTQTQLTYHQSIYDYLTAKADYEYVIGKAQ